MDSPVDPYVDWLGIADKQRPLTNYQLLGLAALESRAELIESHVQQQLAKLVPLLKGEHSLQARRLKFEIESAKTCLLDPATKARYDAHLCPPGAAADLLGSAGPTDGASVQSAVHAKPASPAGPPPAPRDKPPAGPDESIYALKAASPPAPAQKPAAAGLDGNAPKRPTAPGAGEPPFDAYRNWLGIAPEDQPPNHYRLLGIGLFEKDPKVILASSNQRTSYLGKFASGEHAGACRRLLQEISAARLCLLSASQKAAYDRKLREKAAPPFGRRPADGGSGQPLASADDPAADGLPDHLRALSSQKTVEPGRRPGQTATTKRLPLAVGGIVAAVTAVVLLTVWVFHNPRAASVQVAKTADRRPPSPPPPPAPRPPRHPFGTPGNRPARLGLPQFPTSQRARPLPAPAPKPDALPQRQQREAAERGVPVTYLNSARMNMVFIPTGIFLQGRDKRSQQRRFISKPFYLAESESTQGQCQKILSYFRITDPMKPMVDVTWWQAALFCNALSRAENLRPFYQLALGNVTELGGGGYRLPTREEWAYAASGGDESKWVMNARGWKEYAWFGENDNEGPHRVCQKRPGPFGLYDMYGNVWEYCAAPGSFTGEVFHSSLEDLNSRSGRTFTNSITSKLGDVGFRVARDASSSAVSTRNPAPSPPATPPSGPAEPGWRKPGLDSPADVKSLVGRWQVQGQWNSRQITNAVWTLDRFGTARAKWRAGGKWETMDGTWTWSETQVKVVWARDQLHLWATFQRPIKLPAISGDTSEGRNTIRANKIKMPGKSR